MLNEINHLMQQIKAILASISIALTTFAVYLPLLWWMLQRTWTSGPALVRLKKRMDNIILWWTNANRHMIKALKLCDVRVQWHNEDDMSANRWYLVICNHQSWTDIILLQSYLYGKITPP